jgi:carboxypeptidase family protein
MLTNSTVALVAASLVICRVAGAGAQDAGRTVEGKVLDSRNEKPISGAQVYFDREELDAVSGADGSFKAPIGQGGHRFVIRRPGYVPQHAAAGPGAAGERVDLGTVHLRQVKTDADRDTVEAVDLELHPRLASFYDRMHKYRQGSFLTPDDMQRNGGVLSQIIRAKTGFRNMCVANRQGELDCGKSYRGPTTILGSGRPAHEEDQMCFVRVWTDDVGPERALDDIRMDEILAVEAYPNTNTTPREFPGSSCATIRLWMKRAETR